jgi:hypothetical protein
MHPSLTLVTEDGIGNRAIAIRSYPMILRRRTWREWISLDLLMLIYPFLGFSKSNLIRLFFRTPNLM